MDHLALGHHLLQDPEEFTQFCELLRERGTRSYLEIGSWAGGSIEKVAKYLPKGSRIISIEMPADPDKYGRLQQVMGELLRDGYSTFLFTADSSHPLPILMARELGPFDAVFIDGGHTFEQVSRDWRNYGRLAPIVGFHDIAIDKPPNGVARFWKELKAQHEHVEFISEETLRDDIGYGIGVIFNRGEENGSS